MARIARVVVPNIPHHITQRGNWRMDTFISDGRAVSDRLVPVHRIKSGQGRYRQKAGRLQVDSAQAHLQGEDDILVKVEPLLSIIPDWRVLLASDLSEEEYETLRRHERIGRPLGSADFVEKVENQTARVLRRQKAGPKKQ